MKTLTLTLLITSFGLAANPLLAETAVKSNVEPSSQTLAEETVRRQDAKLVAQQLINEGIKLYYDAKYTEAVDKLEKAIKLLPRAPATEVDYNRTARALGDSYYRLADAAFRANATTRAFVFAQKSLDYSPDNSSSKNIIAKIRRSEQKGTASKANGATKASAQASQERTPALNATPEFKDKERAISKLFHEARVLANSGQYDEAEQRYKQVLQIDHYNEDAYRNLQELNSNRILMTEEGVNANRRHRLWEVTEKWLPKLSTDVRRPEDGGKRSETISVSSSAKLRIEAKLKTIIFPDVSFREAAVSDVVKFLAEKSRDYDPEKEGVNIVLGGGLAAPVAPQPAATPDATGAPAPIAAPAPSPSGGIRPVTLALTKVPMSEVLRYVTSFSGLKMRIDNNAVIILPNDAVTDSELISKSYNVSPDNIKALINSVPGATASAPIAAPPVGGMSGKLEGTAVGGTGSGGSAELKKFFEDAGVPFPPGSSLTYFERARQVYVRNNAENLEVFERVLSSFNVVQTQVEIEAKFVEVNQNDLDELGFQWQVGPFQVNKSISPPLTAGSGGPNLSNNNTVTNNPSLSQTLRGVSSLQGNAIAGLLVGATGSLPVPDALAQFSSVINGANASMVINALSQKQSTDTLSAPKITTKTGQPAQIRVVQEFIYPTEYSIPQAGGGGGGTGTVIAIPTPSIPSGWKTREVGVILNVTPQVNADGYTIDMSILPEVSVFIGMLDYSPAPLVFGAGQQLNFKIWQPLFETRNLTTGVVIWDGQTVVLGGLITDAVTKLDDKLPFFGDIPFFGRLFQSKTSSRTKRNLLIFVTARLIDPAGNPIHKLESTAATASPTR